MPQPLGRITYAEAADDESNVLRKLEIARQNDKFLSSLTGDTAAIKVIVSHHLLTNRERCIVSQPDLWIRGGFNVCIPVEIINETGGTSRKVLLRCPLPHSLAQYPGSISEKMRCEVATYIFMQRNCRDIRIPHLWGFRFPDSSAYTHVSHRSILVRAANWATRALSAFLRLPIPSQYTRHPNTHSLPSGYILLEYINCGSMLSNSFELHMGNQQRMNNFLRGLAQVMLCLARLPQPRIGSYIFHDNGTITLTNRPLTMTIAVLEREGASRAIEEHTTYTSVEPYVTDIITYHDNRFREQPNAVNDEYDGVNQMTTSILMRAVAHQYLDRTFREGPFVLQLTDMNQSNFLVDDDWNIKALIDLEWICSLPVQMQGAPYWLTGLGVDEIEGDELRKYENVHERFLSILNEEEARLPANFLNGFSLADLVKKGWHKGTYWYFQCLESVNAMYTLFPNHIRNRHHAEQITKATGQAISKYWSQDAGKILKAKMADKEHYDMDLRTVFVHDAQGR